jgi:AAA+ superfamily predicted ATPase
VDSRARTFVESYYRDCLDAASAATEVFKAWDEYEIDGNTLVKNVFLRTALTYVEFCGERVTDSLASFIIDVSCYFDDETFDWIADMDIAEKQDAVFGYLDAFKRVNQDYLSLEGLAGSLEYALSVCKVYDDAMNTSVRKSLYGALTRFAYLLIDTDNRVTKGEEKFYSLFKEALSGVLTTDASSSHSQDVSTESNIADQSLTSISPEEELQKIIKDIDCLIGLENIKREVSDLINMLRVRQMRNNSGLASPEMSNHMVFYGNPGTGKTTIARKLAEIYRILGILSKGHFIETDRASLVAGYLGQTAIKTTDVLERAKGGILFIDEAYTLSQGRDQDQYGQEAIDTVLKYMEDNRDDLVVIVAGYESKMSEFIDSNPGLKSRFSKYFHFNDYNASQLAEIFAEMAARSQYAITPSFKSSLESLCQLMIARKGENFGNGRTIRNLFERCVSNQANRVVAINNPSHEELIEFLDGDLTINDLDIVMR